MNLSSNCSLPRLRKYSLSLWFSRISKTSINSDWSKAGHNKCQRACRRQIHNLICDLFTVLKSSPFLGNWFEVHLWARFSDHVASMCHLECIRPEKTYLVEILCTHYSQIILFEYKWLDKNDMLLARTYRQCNLD